MEGSHIPLSFHIFFHFKLIIKLSSLPFHFFFSIWSREPNSQSSVCLAGPPTRSCRHMLSASRSSRICACWASAFALRFRRRWRRCDFECLSPVLIEGGVKRVCMLMLGLWTLLKKRKIQKTLPWTMGLESWGSRSLNHARWFAPLLDSKFCQMTHKHKLLWHRWQEL